MRSPRSVALVDEVRALVGARVVDFARVHVVLAYPFTGRSVVDRADGHSAGIDGGFLT